MAETSQCTLSEREPGEPGILSSDASGDGSYRTLLISRIPVERRENGFFTDPLWSRDVNANAQTAAEIFLTCPVLPATDKKMQPLDPRIKGG